MNEIYSWVKNIIIFMVLITIISNLIGKSSYKKYINLITGIILVILVISPLLKIFQLDKTLDYYFTTNSLLAEAEDMNGKLIGMEQEQMSAILSEYKEQIRKQVTSLLEEQNIYPQSIDVVIEEDNNSSNFGNLSKLNIEAAYVRNIDSDKSNNDKEIIIKNIVIDKIKIEKQDGSKEEIERDYLSPGEINVKNLLSDFYNMNPDNINISIQE